MTALQHLLGLFGLTKRSMKDMKDAITRLVGRGQAKRVGGKGRAMYSALVGTEARQDVGSTAFIRDVRAAGAVLAGGRGLDGTPPSWLPV